VSRSLSLGLNYETVDLVGHNIRVDAERHLPRHAASPDIAEASSLESSMFHAIDIT
jgi:hypothetical protein